MKLEMDDKRLGGKLITFCGLDGCGKTTQIKLLCDWLSSKGFDIYLTKQPTDFVRNSQIFRTYTDSEEKGAYDYRALSVFCASDRLQHNFGVITSKLKEGKTVISDRYFYSCLANLWARGYKSDTWIYEIAKYIYKPDLSFFLDVPVNMAIDRVRARQSEKDRYIDISLQYKLRDSYLKIANENNGIIISTETDELSSFKKIQDIVKSAILKG